jgi:citrate synthase
MTDTAATVTIARGLEGIVVGTNHISKVYGDEGRLIYCGYEIEDIAAHAGFEEVVYLLHHGELPDRAQFAAITSELAAARALPGYLLDALAALPRSMLPMSALRSAVSMLVGDDPEGEHPDHAESRRPTAMRLIARFPTIIAAFERLRRGQQPIAPRSELGHAANFLYMLNGVEAGPAAVRALDAYLVLLADHGFNASTFTARVTSSTFTDMYSAITAAIGALKGPLHGGANEGVMTMLEQVGDPSRAEAWVTAALDRRERIMGIGHRVYKTLDPRGTVLRRLSEQVAAEGDSRLLDTAIAVADCAVKYFETNRPELRLYPNVDFYSAPVLHAVGIPTDQFTPLFAMSRIAGWTAHVVEQYGDNRLMRPRSEYVGPLKRAWVPIEARG